jgi:F0F1-type ATP synthase epsilon subunit
MLPPAMKLKKLIKENDVKPTKVIDINTYTKEKLDIDISKCEKNIAKLQKVILNHDDELKMKQNELKKLQLELTQLNDLKNYVA